MHYIAKAINSDIFYCSNACVIAMQSIYNNAYKPVTFETDCLPQMDQYLTGIQSLFNYPDNLL